MPDSQQWPPFVITLCEKFLEEAKGDTDQAAKLMLDHLVGRSFGDPVIEQAIRKAIGDFKRKTR